MGKTCIIKAAQLEMVIPKTLILGIGNILRRDDGVGIHVINRLKNLTLPSSIMLLDGGTAGLDLLHYLHGINKLIVVDAILTDEKPGTVHVLSPSINPFMVRQAHHDTSVTLSQSKGHPFTHSLSSASRPWRPIHHQTGIIETIEMANLLWGKIETVIIGVVPKDYLSYGMELTPETNSAVENVIETIKTFLN